MNVTADATTPLGLGTFGFDDEGVPAAARADRRGGVLGSFLTSRETAAELGHGGGGSMRADGWARMPLVRMTNLHLEPGDGLARRADLRGRRGPLPRRRTAAGRSTTSASTSSSARRSACEIKDGKLGAPLRDATYTGMTPRLLGLPRRASPGPKSGRLYGLTNCGKGQPGQHAHVSHGASPARFRNVQVGVGRELARALVLAERALSFVTERRSGGLRSYTRALGLRALRRLRDPPADARRQRRRAVAGRSRAAGPASRRRTAPTTRAWRSSPAAQPTWSRTRATTRSSSRPAPPVELPDAEGYDEETAALEADGQARLAAAACDRGGGRAGSTATSPAALRGGDRLDHRAARVQRPTDATASPSPPVDGASGYADADVLASSASSTPPRRARGAWRRPSERAAPSSPSRAATAPCRALCARRPAALLRVRHASTRSACSRSGAVSSGGSGSGVRPEADDRRRRARPPRPAALLRLRGRAEAAHRRSSRRA